MTRPWLLIIHFLVSSKFSRGRCGRDRMVVGFTTSSAISAYRYYSWELKYCSGEVYSIQHHRDKVCQWLATGRWFSPGNPVSSTTKTDGHDITEILLKVELNTINNKPPPLKYSVDGERDPTFPFLVLRFNQYNPKFTFACDKSFIT